MKRGVRRALIAGMCGALVLAFAGIAGGKVKTKTFSTGHIDRAVPAGADGDVATTIQSFDLNKKRFKRSKVKDVNVALRLTGLSQQDLEFSLTAPNGRTSLLRSTYGGGSQDSWGSGSEDCEGEFTVFNDEAETPIADGAAPYAGQFRPEERLSGLDGSKVKGAWRLTIDDPYSQASTLHCAELQVKYKKKKKQN